MKPDCTSLNPDYLLEVLQKLKVDCLFTRGNHLNAAQRVQTEANQLRIWLIIGSVCAAFSGLMNIGVWDKIGHDTFYIQIAVNILGALGSILVLYTTSFGDYKTRLERAAKHQNIGVALNLLFKQIRNTEAYYKAGILKDAELKENLDADTETYCSICNGAPITTDKDYRQTKANFNAGHTADYTKEELNS